MLLGLIQMMVDPIDHFIPSAGLLSQLYLKDFKVDALIWVAIWIKVNIIIDMQ